MEIATLYIYRDHDFLALQCINKNTALEVLEDYVKKHWDDNELWPMPGDVAQAIDDYFTYMNESWKIKPSVVFEPGSEMQWVR